MSGSDRFHREEHSNLKSKKMKNIVLPILFFLLGFTQTLYTQNDYYMRQARSYQREAEYYTKNALRYERKVEYYYRQAQGYLREAGYYSRRKDYNNVKFYQQRVPRAPRTRQRTMQERHATQGTVLWNICGKLNMR